jgi:hypothetical protein
MTISRKVLEYVTAEPFRPFRIRMASGQSFDFGHSEMIVVGKTSVRVYTTGNGRDQNENWHDASLMLTETIESLDTPVPQSNEQ